MRTAALALIGASLLGLCSLAEAGRPLEPIEIDVRDKVSLQRGAKVFVNYCLSCHSASYMRFSRIASDLVIPEPLMVEKLMFVTDKIGNTMEIAMRAVDAEAWFGVVPPDLSVIARSRSPDWLFAFLTSFYLDPSRPTGVNNLESRGTAMPHVLWEYQGWRRLAQQVENAGRGGNLSLEMAIAGRSPDSEYKNMVRDLVSFLAYLAEPVKPLRQNVGIGVLLYLAVFLAIVYLLKKEYWKDI